MISAELMYEKVMHRMDMTKETKEEEKLSDKSNLREFLLKEKERKQNLIDKLAEEIKEIEENLKQIDDELYRQTRLTV